jgi:hypothetical protein
MVAQAQAEQHSLATHLSHHLAISFYRFISLAAFNKKILRLPMVSHPGYVEETPPILERRQNAAAAACRFTYKIP